MVRMHTVETYQEDSSAMSRFPIWGLAIKIGLERPLIGAGFHATDSQAVVNRFEPGVEARAVHNVFLNVLAEHGFIGLMIWTALALVGWRNSRWIVRHSMGRPEWQWAGDFARMSQAAFVGYMVTGSFHNTQYWDYYFTIIGLLAAARGIMETAALPQRVPATTVVLSRAAPGS